MEQRNSAFNFSRRNFMALSGSASAFCPLFTPPVFGQTNASTGPCGAIFQKLEHARAAYVEAGSWAITVAPDSIQRLEQQATNLRREISEARSDLSNARWPVILDSTNALATGVIYLLGVTGTVAAAPLYIGTLAVSGVFLIARAASQPADVTASEFVLQRTLDQLEGLLSNAGENSVVLSHNASRYSAQAGRLVGGLNLLLQFWAAYSSLSEMHDHHALAERLERSLDEVEAGISRLQDISSRIELRQACAQALGEDLEQTFSMQCGEPQVP